MSEIVDHVDVTATFPGAAEALRMHVPFSTSLAKENISAMLASVQAPILCLGNQCDGAAGRISSYK